MSQSAPTTTQEPSGGICLLNPLEIRDWDQQVGRLANATFFHSSAWAGVLEGTYGYSPLYIGKRTAGDITSLLPLMEVNSWLTGRRGVSLPFTDLVEPLCQSGDDFPTLFDFAKKLAATSRWKNIEFRTGKRWFPGTPSAGAFYNHSLELQKDDEALFSTLDPATRRAVRKAERSDLKVEFSQSSAAMSGFYRLLCKTRQKHGVPPQPYRFFANIQKDILKENHGWVVLARFGDTPVAGAVFFHFGKHVIYKFGASDESFQQLRANNLVMWKAIQHFARESFATLDFGRTSLDNAGLRRYKLSWGTRETLVEYTRYSPQKNTYESAKDKSSGWHTRIFNQLPTFLSRPIGAMLYRHMG